MPKLSRNELCALALKAARGAGVPLGHAEDFSAAVGFMQTFDGLVGVLDEPLETSAVMTMPLALDALIAGADEIAANIQDTALVEGYIGLAKRDYRLDLSFDGAVLRKGGTAPSLAKGPVAVPQATFDYLNRFAAKTYVPATEASRLAGAGAGLTDND